MKTPSPNRTPEDECQFCGETKPLERCHADSRSDGKPIMACSGCHWETCEDKGNCKPEAKETRLDLLQRVSEDLGWHTDSRGRDMVEVEIETLLDWIIEDRKTQATALLEKILAAAPTNPSFETANEMWRSIIKEYLA